MFKDGPIIKSIPLDRRLICKEEFYQIPKRQIVSMTTNEETLFSDLISQPFLMISEMIMSVIQMYGDIVLKRDIVFVDSKSEVIKRYFIVLFEKVKCNNIETKTDRGRIIYIIRQGQPLKERNIFEVEIDKKREIIINLDLAESILRRDAFGIDLEAVEVYEIEKVEDKHYERETNTGKTI